MMIAENAYIWLAFFSFGCSIEREKENEREREHTTDLYSQAITIIMMTNRISK